MATRSYKPFQFQQFSVEQDKSLFKIGVDGVLFGSWLNCNEDTTVLDVGTGTGLIALMLAQRFSSISSISGIEMDNNSADEATFNFQNSRWQNRLNCVNQKFQDFTVRAGSWSHIVSNPPFFNKGIVAGEGKLTAKHQITLSVASLIEQSLRLLHPEGKISFICHTENWEKILQLLSRNQLFIRRKLNVIPKKNKPSHRIFVEVSTKQIDYVEESITIRDNNNQYTKEYQDITKDFYLT